MATLRLPSGETRLVPATCKATVGVGRQRRARADPARQGGPRALAGQAPVGARRRDEPGRPPARAAARASPPAAGIRPRRGAKPRAARARRRRRRTSTSFVVAGRGVADAAVAEEGSVRRRPPDEEGRRHEQEGREEGGAHVVAPLDDRARHARSHDRRARRPQARAGVRLGGDGRAQARRVRPDAHVPVARDATSGGIDRMPEARATSKYNRTSARKMRRVGGHDPWPARRGGPAHPALLGPRRLARRREAAALGGRQRRAATPA